MPRSQDQERDVNMNKIIRFSMMSTLVLILAACNLSGTATPKTNASISGDGTVSVVELLVQAQNATATFNTVGQVINYIYVVTNAGTAALAGPVIVTDDKVVVNCPNVNTVGNSDNNLDATEGLTCTSAYSITQADLDAGKVTSNATAKVGTIDSDKVTTVINMTPNKVLALTISPSPTTYNQAGQIITFSYTIKNTGVPTLGPAQFIVRDDHVAAPINCGAATTTLPTNQPLNCTANYTISQTDMSASQLTTNATASGGGAAVIQPASVTITNSNITTNPAPSNWTKHSTIFHNVVAGEWMLQIKRCYGANFSEMLKANPQVTNPARISPGMVLTIPNIGSDGNIYGPPCVGYYTVQSGDNWNSIAQKYNADIDVLQEANQIATPANGSCIRVPLNSAGGNITQQPFSLVPCNSSTTGTNPVPPPLTPIRINPPFTQSSNVSAQGKVRYVFNANQGQILNVRLAAPANEVTLAVFAVSGFSLKQQDTTLTWNGSIPSNGDYIIEIVGVSGTSNKPYTLEVSLTNQSLSPFERVADINSGAGSSDPSYLTLFNGALYFKATGSDNAGAELWKYDINLRAASIVKDINPGPGSSDPSYLTVYGSALYFRANGNDGAGTELWRSNGNNDAGRMREINVGTGDSNPAYLAAFNNLLYFSANGNDGMGVELWKNDGTTSSRVSDIHPGAGDSNSAYLTVYNGVLYFSAVTNDGNGVELWKYDGVNPPSLSFDINAGVGNSNPSYLTVFNNALYFSANGNDGKGTELWKYDGANPPSLAFDINSGAGDSGPSFLTVFNGALYFSANGNDGKGTELWKYDGTNVTRVSDLNTTGNSNPAYLCVVNNELYFQANANDSAGTELWKFKGP